jgi:hypothetical protein
LNPVNRTKLLRFGLLASFSLFSNRSSSRWTKVISCDAGPSAAAFIPAASFLISAGDNCGRSTLIVSLLREHALSSMPPYKYKSLFQTL